MPFLLFMPSYNQAHYIADAVRSVLAQDDPDWELWIVDNSTDETPQVMRQFDDQRIHFHHIPQRMDPGTCLNWMLERAVGREFSYVHTDNNLQPDYVRQLREALADHPLGLAYCDMRTIDDTGRYIQVFRRGKFDLPRLLSTDPLGVPFAATTQLARQLGGFGTWDFADDVRFCASAYGLADYIYIATPLLDYRNHKVSRTEQAGGSSKMQRLFVDLMPKILPAIEQRGLRPLNLVEKAIRAELDGLEWFIEDLWYRRLSARAQPWWNGYPKIDHFFWTGLLPLPGFAGNKGPPRLFCIRDNTGSIKAHPIAMVSMRHSMHKRRHEIRRLTEKAHQMLLPWACMKLGISSDDKISIRIRSLDTRTLWAARQLEHSLGWKPVLDPAVNPIPKWIDWERANGTEPLLDCSGEICITQSGTLR